ncbi:MAG: hypothetical protein WDA22_05925 [Bacteroidota bacterium]
MNKLLRNITVILVIFSMCSATGNEPSHSDREILFRLCDSTMQAVASMELQQFHSVRLLSTNDQNTTYFQTQFIQGLVSRNIPLFVEKDSSETTLELTVRESSVLYSELFTDSFLGSRKTERTVAFSIVASLISHMNGKVLWSKAFSSSFVDTVLYSEIEQLHDGSIPLTKNRVPTLSFFDSILEPAIVTIASGVAIYLFFTIRS